MCPPEAAAAAAGSLRGIGLGKHRKRQQRQQKCGMASIPGLRGQRMNEQGDLVDVHTHFDDVMVPAVP